MPKVTFRFITPTRIAAMDTADPVPGCCVDAQAGCCGVPFYKASLVEGLHEALKSVLELSPRTQEGAPVARHRQAAFTGAMTVAAGALWECGAALERRIVGSAGRELEALRTRQDVIRGLQGHMEREMWSKGAGACRPCALGLDRLGSTCIECLDDRMGQRNC